MEQILELLKNSGLNSGVFWAAVAIIVAGTLLLACISRMIFGKRSTLNRSISSSIGIIFLYAVAIVLFSAGLPLGQILNTLPLLSASGTTITFFSFHGAHYTEIASELLSVVILAFIANLLESILPAKRNIFAWLFFRILTVAGAAVLHILCNWLLATYLPEGLATYAPVILLSLAVVLLLVGSLKFLVGAALTAVNPLIGAFYTFYFATLVGKALTKSILTAAILSAIILGLGAVGCTALSIATSALVAYVPLALVLLFTWYLVDRTL